MAGPHVPCQVAGWPLSPQVEALFSESGLPQGPTIALVILVSEALSSLLLKWQVFVYCVPIFWDSHDFKAKLGYTSKFSSLCQGLATSGFLGVHAVL